MDSNHALVEPKATSQTPYQLDITQTTKACKVLKRRVQEDGKSKESQSTKRNLLAGNDDSTNEEEEGGDGTPLWLIVTTKKHIVDQKRLKPNKIALPHSFNTDPSATICLITADPQRLYKDAIAHPSFPAALRPRVARVIGVSKLKAKYKAFEARRQLLAEHDVFLADDRIVTYLPQILGKVFYKGGSKRPVPVSIAAPPKRGDDGKRIKKRPEVLKKKDEEKRGAARPEEIAKEIEKALGSALVHLSPGTSTAVKVANAGLEPEMTCRNIEAVVAAMTGKLITQGWRNIRAIHIKGPNTVAFPIWLASELWVEDGDVLEEKKTFGKKKAKALEAAESKDDDAEKLQENGNASKRKAAETEKPTASKHAKKKRKAEMDEKLAAEAVSRKERLRKEKALTLAEI